MAGNGDSGGSLGPCPICGREMIAGAALDRHHWVPRLRGGAEADWLHRVCHRMIHKVFGEAELAARYATPEALRAHPEIARFIAWVRRKPPEFVDWPRAPRGRNPRRPGKRR